MYVAIRWNKIKAGTIGEVSQIIEGAAHATAFERYVEGILAPSLTPGQIVIMDNLAADFG